MRNLLDRFKADQAGTATIEFVLWVPVFVFILGLILDGTLLMIGQTNMNKVASDTARQVSVGAVTTANAQAYARNHSFGSNHYDVVTTKSSGVVKVVIEVDVGDVGATGFFSAFGSRKLKVMAIQRIEVP